MNYIGKVERFKHASRTCRIREVMLVHFTLPEASQTPRLAMLEAVATRKAVEPGYGAVKACWCLPASVIPMGSEWWEWQRFGLNELTPADVAAAMERVVTVRA